MVDRLGQCVGKTRYVSGTEAHRALKKRAKRYARANVYRCGECGGYHIGRRSSIA